MADFKQQVASAKPPLDSSTESEDASWLRLMAHAFDFFFKADFNFDASQFCTEDLALTRSPTTRKVSDAPHFPRLIALCHLNHFKPPCPLLLGVYWFGLTVNLNHVILY